MGVVIGNKIKHLFLTMMREMYGTEIHIELCCSFKRILWKQNRQNRPTKCSWNYIYDCVEFSVVFLINNPHHIFCKGNVSDGIYLISVSTQSTSWECLTFTITALDPISHFVHMYSLQHFFIPKNRVLCFINSLKKIRVHFDFSKNTFC